MPQEPSISMRGRADDKDELRVIPSNTQEGGFLDSPSCYTFQMHTWIAVFVAFFLMTPVAYAQSTPNLQAELNALLAQLAALQAQLQGGGGGAPLAPVSTAPSSASQCPSLSRTLRQGMSGPDVSALQAFLALDKAIYQDGSVTGFFGPLTQMAIQRFQAKHGIVNGGSPDSNGYGAVGPATRATILALCSRTSAPQINPSLTCTLGGVTVASGATQTFYSTTQAPLNSTCAAFSAVRQCVNGSFSGNAAFQYRSCVESEAASCVAEGERVAHGTSFTFFSKRRVTTSGESCSQFAQTRSCSNGVLSGSNEFRYLSCKVDISDSCSAGGVTVPHGQSRTFYRYDAATSTNSCASYAQTRTCDDGVLSGSSDFNKPSCSIGGCMLDGVTVPSGSSTTFYLAQNVPATEQCASYAQTRSCSSGVLSGNASYMYRTCAPVAGGSCALDNIVVAPGASAMFYSASAAPAGASCASIRQARTCTNGTFSGTATFNRSSCTDTASCALDGVTVAHGNSATFYSERTVAFGTTCSSKAQTRACTNGKLSGTATFQYGACSVNPPTSLAPSDSQLATALSALEAILKDALVQLDSWF